MSGSMATGVGTYYMYGMGGYITYVDLCKTGYKDLNNFTIFVGSEGYKEPFCTFLWWSGGIERGFSNLL